MKTAGLEIYGEFENDGGSLINKQYVDDKVAEVIPVEFNGTVAEWEALTPEEQATYDVAYLYE